MSELVTVRLIGLPVDLHALTVEHDATMRRELALVEHGEAAEMSERLATLTAELRGRFGGFGDAQRTMLEEAHAAGTQTIDLTYEMPRDAADAAVEIGRLLDEADELCRRGELVTLCTPRELVTYRRWFLEEFVEQIRSGRAPVPWSSSAASTTSAATRDVTATAEEVPAIEPILADGDLDLLGAPTLRQAIASRLEGGESSVVVDLSGCQFVDSVGLSLLLTTRERCIGLGGSFRVIGIGPEVRALLDTVGVLDLLTGEPLPESSQPPA